jgi:hypothetical protein
MGEGGAWRGGLLLAAFVVIGIALFATVDDSRSGTSAATAGETSSGTLTDEPCGGAAAVPAVVRSSAVGGLSGSSASYDVTDVRVSTTDPTWGRFSVVAKAGQEANFQNAHGVVQCTLLGWSVTDVGTNGVGCGGTNSVPVAVRSDLGVTCPN